MEKQSEIKNPNIIDNKNQQNKNTDVKKTFYITKDVIEECLETFLG